ncbi:hypothetical protein V500_02409 [Pseudogymnoascus sp. VKM F-4518 (FW-2643)]|nr:hypothetical protein V500_02409 [Pseudogymnoascus sp. VKM F-4518 (FW-2643)]
MLASHDQRAQKQSGPSAVIVAPVSYQTFHRSNFTRFFEVATPLEPNVRAPKANLLPPPLSLEEQVELQLAGKTRAFDERDSTVLQPPSEQSVWLQTTEWVRYLQGHNLGAAARLVALPHSSEPEPDLVAILGSFDCLIEQARDSVLQGKINAFDQQRIHSFLRAGSRTSKASDRPLAHQLKRLTISKFRLTGTEELRHLVRKRCLSSTEIWSVHAPSSRGTKRH